MRWDLEFVLSRAERATRAKEEIVEDRVNSMGMDPVSLNRTAKNVGQEDVM